MFEKTLTDVVKGIRSSKRDTALYISQCIAEIKTEISSSDMYVKANALQKLTFLQMMGYSMNWASFATIEVMSSPRFAHKRIGYLAASQGFTQDTEVVLLTTNLLKKELRGAVGGGMHGVYEAGLAINCISNIVTEDLASDLLPELTNLTSHPQPYLRKKAILCLYKVFVKYPQGLRLTFTKLQQCLSDSNSSVVSCAVNVITELSDKNPKNYLHLAPAFFDLLTQSSNNWMLIKVVKLLGSLVPEEPRLARKLLEPLASIVRNTQAKSLLYEAVHTITLCLPYCRKNDGSMPANIPDIVILCAQILRSFVEESDQNLKYLGLVGFGSLVESHPRVLSAPDYRPLILACLSDQDVTIRTRALDLLKGMASQKNLMELVTQLLKHVEKATGNYRLDLVEKIVGMCSGDKYALLHDFSWYLDILFQLGHMRGIEKHADLLRAQITDVALRVLPIRAYAVRQSIKIMLEGDSTASDDDQNEDGTDLYRDNGRGRHIMPEIRPGVAWIIGEYSDLIREALSNRFEEDDEDGEDEEEEFAFDEISKGTYHAIIQALTAPSNTHTLPTSTQKVYVQSTMKVFSAATADTHCSTLELEACVETIRVNMAIFMKSIDAEVVERACTSIELVDSLLHANGGANVLSAANGVSPNDLQGDLFGMIKQGSNASNGSAEGSLILQLKHVSPTINYLLKPSPMKPVGAKSQRKKRTAPAGSIVDLDTPANLSLLGDLLAEEENLFSRTKSNMECVSFTQQIPRHVEEPALTSIASPASLDAFSHLSAPQAFAHGTSLSFQKPAGPPAAQRLQGDPFYLGSTPSSGQEKQEKSEGSRFGTIQLIDSDEERPSSEKKAKRKKDKNAKRMRTKNAASNSDNNLMAFGEASSNLVPSIYESDDDAADDGGYRNSGPSALVGRRKGPSKEFEGLAKVDLTTPLREDEVMPERRHRVVPERPLEQPVPEEKSKKRPKKAKKKRSAKTSSSEAVGDLLGLEGLIVSEVAPPMAGLATTSSAASNSNPINSAFDDLLGFSNPAPAPILGELVSSTTDASTGVDAFGQSAPLPNRKLEKRPWLVATLKLSSASGPPSCDWSQTALHYRVHRTHHAGNPAASVVFRFENRSLFQVNTLTIELQNQGNAELGTISAGSWSVESNKLGPIPYHATDSSQECKGVLLSSDGCHVNFKVSLPASVFLNPDSNLSLDTVAQELSSGNWSSHSAKIEIVSSGLTADEAKSVIGAFLRAEEVEKHNKGGPVAVAAASAATFAASSAGSGARVRVLAKFSAACVKVDIRCTSSTLGKALASDIKRLLL